MLQRHIADSANPHSVTATQVGLGSVDNTADADKPVSTLQQSALDLKLDITAIDDVPVDGELAAPISSNWAHDHAAASNPHGTSASDVGLGNVDNTSDLDKPISSATQTALDGKANIAHDHDEEYEPKNANIQAHISDATNPHGVTVGQIGALGVITPSGITDDPNGFDVGLKLSQHENCPTDDKYWYVLTFFYNTQSGTADRAQLAMSYNDSAASMYVRHYYSVSGWTSWVKCSNEAFATEAQALAGTADNVVMTPAKTALLVGRKNYIINGNFDIWQRGTAFAGPLSGVHYTADRWNCTDGTNGLADVSRQGFTLGQTEVPGNPLYFLRYNLSTAITDGTPAVMQKIEGVQTLAGNTCTISLWMKASKSISFGLGFLQSFGTGASSSEDVIISVGSANVTTSWTKFVFTATLPSILGKTLDGGNDSLVLRINIPLNDTFVLDIAQVQLEKGSFATDFEQRSSGEELALCQRYYWTGKALGYGSGNNYADGNVLHEGPYIVFPTLMRVAPTMSISTAPTYTNCSTNATPFDVSMEGAMHRLNATAAGRYRAYNGVYEADAEL